MLGLTLPDSILRVVVARTDPKLYEVLGAWRSAKSPIITRSVNASDANVNDAKPLTASDPGTVNLTVLVFPVPKTLTTAVDGVLLWISDAVNPLPTSLNVSGHSIVLKFALATPGPIVILVRAVSSGKLYST